MGCNNVLDVDMRLGSWTVKPVKAQSLVYTVVKMYKGNADFFMASLLVATGLWRRLRFFVATWKEQGWLCRLWTAPRGQFQRFFQSLGAGNMCSARPGKDSLQGPILQGTCKTI